MAEPHWLPAEELRLLNQADRDESDQSAVMADVDAIQRALHRPRSLWTYHEERDTLRLACALVTGLIEERPFGQGNLSTAVAAVVMFLEANGYRWVGPDGRVLAAYVSALADGRYTEEGLAETLRPDVLPA